MSHKTHDHEQCRAFFEKLSEYIDHELDQASCEAIEQHLQHCPPCQACLATLQQTVAMCRKMKSAAMPEAFSQRLRDIIRRNLE